MNKNKILELVEEDFLTILNLERSVQFALNSYKGKQYQFKVSHAAFKRTCDIMLRRRKEIAKMLGLKLKTLQDPVHPTRHHWTKRPKSSQLFE